MLLIVIVSHHSSFLNNTDVLHLNRFKLRRYRVNLEKFVQQVPGPSPTTLSRPLRTTSSSSLTPLSLRVSRPRSRVFSKCTFDICLIVKHIFIFYSGARSASSTPVPPPSNSTTSPSKSRSPLVLPSLDPTVQKSRRSSNSSSVTWRP